MKTQKNVVRNKNFITLIDFWRKSFVYSIYLYLFIHKTLISIRING